MPRQFSLIAATVYGNRGAEAMLCSAIGTLREQMPDAHFHVFSYYPDDDRARVTAPHVSIHSATPAALVCKWFPLALLYGTLRSLLGQRVLRMAPRAIRALGESEALLDLAGVAFIDGREKFLPYNVLTLLPAMLLRTPVVKMPQAVGPFANRWNRLASGWVLPRCRKTWARGEGTLAHLQQASIPGLRFELGDDLAFNYKPEWSLSEERPPGFSALLDMIAGTRDRFRGVIGLCPSSVVATTAARTGVAYESVMVDLVAGLVEEGFLVVLFPNATRHISGARERNNDLPLIGRIQTAAHGRGCPPTAVCGVDEDINTASIKELIGVLDVALVSRFHAMVGALSMGVPVTVLGWSHKYREVMARFGLESQVLDYTRSAVTLLQAKVMDTFAARQAVHAAIMQHLPEVQEAARKPLLEWMQTDMGSNA